MGFGLIVHIELNNSNGVEVGYRLKKDLWGNGYATEITRILLQYGFNHLNLTEIWGTTHPDNIGSQKVLLKAGLLPEGEAAFHDGCKIFRIKK